MSDIVCSISSPASGIIGARSCGLFIMACGFERRALHLWRQLPLSAATQVIAFAYQGGPAENDTSRSEVADTANSRGQIHWLSMPAYPQYTRAVDDEFRKMLSTVRHSIDGEVWIDISGISNWAIAIAIAALLDFFPASAIRVLYTAASKYYPTKLEYDRYRAGKQPFDLPPAALSYDVQSNLVPERFSGNNIDVGQTCLILFAGYESHRSQAAIEDINPSKVVFVYGKPPSQELAWRTNLSIDLHSKVAQSYNHTAKELITSDLAGALNLILTFYKYLYEDHLLRVAPINSKIHALAALLAWRRFPDIQLCFPQAVKYLPERFSSGVDCSYVVDMGKAWNLGSQTLM